MQASQSSNQTTWKEIYQDALFELDPTKVRSKLEAAKQAIEDRFAELYSNGVAPNSEVTQLCDAQRVLLYFQTQEQLPNNSS